MSPRNNPRDWSSGKVVEYDYVWDRDTNHAHDTGDRPFQCVIGENHNEDMPLHTDLLCRRSLGSVPICETSYYLLLANVQGERREAAAGGVRFISELNGCFPFAPP